MTPMKLNKRERLLQWLVNYTATFYLKTFKAHKAKWKYSKDDLRSFPTGSLGKEIANFLDENNIDLIPKAENHDVFHMVTGYKTTAVDEIAMQYWLVGNGKITPYTIGTCIIGAIVIPENWSAYLKAFKKGRNCSSIVHWNFEELLYSNSKQIKDYVHHSNPVTIYSSY